MTPPPRTGDGLLHPVALAAMAVLGANDHWGKSAFPGLITGKLSDVAGLLFFPLLLEAMAEWGHRAVGRPWGPSRLRGRLLVVVTGIVFALVKTWSPMGVVYQWGLGLLQAPFNGGIVRVTLHQDPTDLVALVALVVPWGLMRSRALRADRPR